MSDTETIPTQDQDVHCPLCDYNLRGLAEARCPECGARFEWDELRDPARRKHPYLFEHHPERNVRSFFRTLIGSLLPRRFWRKLSPVQHASLRRLVIYWIICLGACAMIVPAQYIVFSVGWYQSRSEFRAALTRYFTSPPPGSSGPYPNTRYATTQQTAEVIQQYGSVQRFIDQRVPAPTLANFYHDLPSPVPGWWRAQRISGNMLGGRAWSKVIGTSLLLWPWAAAGIMMLFRASMRQTKVSILHLFRVTIYSADILFWVGAIVSIAMVVQEALLLYWPPWRGSPLYVFWRDDLKILWFLPGVLMFVLTWRLAIGIKRYLRFRHAPAVAISVQVIFALLAAQVFWIVQ